MRSAAFSSARVLAVATAAAAALLAGTRGIRAEEFGGSAALYVWLPRIDGEFSSAAGGRTVETSISRGDLLESLDFGVMGAGEITYGRFALLNDTVYSDLGNDGSVRGNPSVSVDVDTKMLLTTTAFGYHAYVDRGRLIEPFAGARYVRMSTDVTATSSAREGATAGADLDVSWWDPVIGVRGRLPLSETWTVGGIAEIGGFGIGSEFTWQIFAGVEYAISERVSANAGFRYLSIRYSADRVDVDVSQYGPLVGLVMRF
ncbi:hypothetical protein JL101_033710 (plasmid) [Skermanella rosea]|uniref:outer membrane protein n=1 Tax=Skermanella rosea TaxID=1817965 RepID=UPI001933676F|nr:hypothetical protein [Skermanella rosea]UEM07433.1 hypothetical protein JL101_033710 [Skermanella rosea]